MGLLLCDLVYNLKQKRQQHNIAKLVTPKQQSEPYSLKGNVTDVGATSVGLLESHKRRRSCDVHHVDDVPCKRLKFSSLFTNNPEIPHVDRLKIDS